jgi:cytochrome c-type biogenesis protein CcmH/NrfG
MPEAPEKVVAKAQAKAKAPGKAKIGSVDNMVAGLAERLKNQPDDLQGWVMLGKSYKFIKQFDKAAEAFSKANILAGTDPEIMLQYADSLVMVNQGSFAGEAKRLIFKALELDSDNATGLWLAGKVKVEEGEYVAALKYLRILQPQLERGSQHYQELETFIANVQSQIEGGKANTVTSVDSNVVNNGSNEENIISLEERLKNNPDDLQGWADLANAYKRLKQYDKAISAFEKSKVLSGNQADVMLMYADALVMRDDGQYSEQAKALIFKALELKPDDTTALWLGGKTKVQEGKYNEALQYLRKAETNLQPGSQSHNIMLGYIVYVESLIASSTTTSMAVPAVNTKMSETNKTQASGEARIQVKVTLSAELQNQTTANDTVFIYAKAMSGPQMPLAIVRKKVSDLPVTVWLTDTQAMMPMMKLSKFNNVKLTARISKSGNAITQPGDIIGVVNSVSVTSQQVININIDRIIN